MFNPGRLRRSSASPTPGKPGGEETFTLKVTNNGPDATKGVLVLDPIPTGLEFVSAKAPCNEEGGQVKCPLGTLAKGEERTLEFVVRIPESAAEGFVNTAIVTSTTPDPDLSNNSDTVAVPLLPEADLKIKKIALPKHLTAGGHVAYLIGVHNSGPHFGPEERLKTFRGPATAPPTRNNAAHLSPGTF